MLGVQTDFEVVITQIVDSYTENKISYSVLTNSEHKMHQIQCDRPLESHARNRNKIASCSVDHLLQLLHGQSANSLGSWFGLEHAWLLGEVLS